MTIIKEGAGGIWHIYDKDTGKGKRLVVRTSHSVQRSQTLKAWQAFFAEQAHAGAIATEAKRRCMEKAAEAPERYYSDVRAKRCKMSVLRLFLRDVLKEVAKQRPARARRSRARAAATATGGTAAAGGAAGGAAGATSEIGEVEGIEF